jgi:hypothetical protein
VSGLDLVEPHAAEHWQDVVVNAPDVVGARTQAALLAFLEPRLGVAVDRHGRFKRGRRATACLGLDSGEQLLEPCTGKLLLADVEAARDRAPRTARILVREQEPVASLEDAHRLLLSAHAGAVTLVIAQRFARSCFSAAGLSCRRIQSAIFISASSAASFHRSKSSSATRIRKDLSFFFGDKVSTSSHGESRNARSFTSTPFPVQSRTRTTHALEHLHDLRELAGPAVERFVRSSFTKGLATTRPSVFFHALSIAASSSM